MDGDAFTPNSPFPFGNASEAAMDWDFMDELLFEGCWLETSDNLSQPAPPTSGALHDQGAAEATTSAVQSGSFLIEGTESSSSWWIGPRVESGPSSSVKERLMQAVGFLKESTKDRDVLIQIWVPVKRGGKNVLTTEDQPYSVSPNSRSLASYRGVSENYNFPAEGDSNDSVGLPGLVFLGKLPEWTPDVRFFKSDEYPRINFARKYGVRGSLALPVFERGSGTCLGVVEIVTTQNINYGSDLENVSKALEVVDLRSSHNFSLPSLEGSNEVYKVALDEIAKILTSICKRYRLPLAQTWAPCINQGKGGSRHSNENYRNCVSTVDWACCVAEEEFRGFHEACSEHHLLRGQGIVGRAFTANKQCFANDVTSFSKTKYPLSHHARMFGLHAAVAIPLRSINAVSAEFVLEVFLPKECRESEQQKQLLSSLSICIQQACQALHIIVDQQLEEGVILQVASERRTRKEESQFGSSSKKSSPEESFWIAHMTEAQKKGKVVSVSWEYQEENPEEEFKLTPVWDNCQLELSNKQAFSEFGHVQQISRTKGSDEGGGESSSSGGRHGLGGRKAGARRQTRMEKTISLEVLQQYFAGSLKDAAKSIGVCPTTLKRICRQHGITRWPSRKIKKVGHSLRKLQLVINSVQGAEDVQIGSFYRSFPELGAPNISGSDPLSSVKRSDPTKPSAPQQEICFLSRGVAAPKSSSSSSGSQSSGSRTCSTRAKQHVCTMNASVSEDVLTVEDLGGILKRSLHDARLHALNQEEPKLLVRSQSQSTLISEHPSAENLPPMPKSTGRNPRPGGSLRVKATFGDVKIRFSLQPNWGFRDLQQEIARRFNIDDVSQINLKYLDDDHEWVLLTCDADLEECTDIYKSSQSQTIKISIIQSPQPNVRSSFGSNTTS